MNGGRSFSINNTNMKAQKIWFENGRIFLTTDDGRTGSLLLRAFPRLARASDEQRMKYELSRSGIHWPELDEDLVSRAFLISRRKRRTTGSQWLSPSSRKSTSARWPAAWVSMKPCLQNIYAGTPSPRKNVRRRSRPRCTTSDIN